METYSNEIRLIFTGNFGYLPNKDAIIHFVKDIFPLIYKQCPNVRLVIGGPGDIEPKFTSAIIELISLKKYQSYLSIY